jgi:hypothetical protein
MPDTDPIKLLEVPVPKGVKIDDYPRFVVNDNGKPIGAFADLFWALMFLAAARRSRHS